MDKQIFKIRWYAWIWEFPQTVLGLCLALFLKWKDPKHFKVTKYQDSVIIRSKSYPWGGVSLGGYIFLHWNNYLKDSQAHEYGHCKQSKILGPLYLLVVGIPSIVHLWIHEWLYDGKKYAPIYYHFYTEKWADKLVGIVRTSKPSAKVLNKYERFIARMGEI
jgi:hypothetical protein